MGRSPCCEKDHTNKGAWTKEEDDLLINYIRSHGDGSWRSLPKAAGLQRCGKSCRLRWINYLRPDLKRGHFTKHEDDLILHLHSLLGNKWSMIASRLPGRTDNEVKNYWNTHIKRKLISAGIDTQTHHPPLVHTTSNPSTVMTVSCTSNSSNSDRSLNVASPTFPKKFELPFPIPTSSSSPPTRTVSIAAATAAKPSYSWNQHPPPVTVSEYSNSSSALTSEELIFHSPQPLVQAQAKAEQPNLELSIGLPSSRSFRPYDSQKQQLAFGNLQVSSETLTLKGVCLCYRLGLEKSTPASSCNCRGTTTLPSRWW